MKRTNALMAAVLVVVMCLLVQSCGEKGDATEDAPVIGVSILTSANPFFGVLADGIEEEAAKHGYEVITVSGDSDVAKQKDQVSDFIVQKVAAIVLCPCDSKAIGTSIQKANKAGIPVFTADIACLAEGAEVVCHVATDNYGGGEDAARAIIEALGGEGQVAILDYPEVESVLARTKGFKAELKRATEEDGVNIEIVGTWPCHGAKDEGLKSTEDILQAHPDLDGIFAINDPAALGAVAAIEKAGRTGEIKLVGFDGQPEGRQAIKDGKIYADPIQYPRKIGRTTAQSIVDYMNGKKVPSEKLIPTTLYKKADADKDPMLKKESEDESK